MSIKHLFDYTQPVTAAATILASAFVVVGVGAGALIFTLKNAGDTVSVTGSAREYVTADFAKLSITLETRVGVVEQQMGFEKLDAASKRIVSSLSKNGLTDVEVPVGSTNAQYIYPNNSEPILVGYSVSRSIIIRSEDVKKLEELASTIKAFTGEGYTVAIGGVELTYRNLDTMRIKLLSGAIRDAKARAGAIASESGRSVGALKSSAAGVVQVLPKGGVEVSDYGTYDTMSLEKEVMVTVRATFALD